MTLMDDARSAGATAGGAKKKKRAAKKAARSTRSAAPKPSRVMEDGRRSRKPAEQTIRKQVWVFEQLQKNPDLPISHLMDMVKSNFDKMMSHPRVKQVKDHFEAGGSIDGIREGKLGGSGPSGTGRGRGRGGRALGGGSAPPLMIALRRRNRWDLEEVRTEAEANHRLSQLIRDGAPADEIAIYRREEFNFAIRIGR